MTRRTDPLPFRTGTLLTQPRCIDLRVEWHGDDAVLGALDAPSDLPAGSLISMRVDDLVIVGQRRVFNRNVRSY